MPLLQIRVLPREHLVTFDQCLDVRLQMIETIGGGLRSLLGVFGCVHTDIVSPERRGKGSVASDILMGHFARMLIEVRAAKMTLSDPQIYFPSAFEGYSPAYLHGVIIGGAVGSGEANVADIKAVLARVLDHPNANADADADTEDIEEALAALDDDDLIFAPLLPDDDEQLEQRLLALKEWVSGYLAGFADGLGHRRRDEEERDAEDAADATSANSRMGTEGSPGKGAEGESTEILSDFVAIAELDPSDDEAAVDEAEADYAELVEYLRAGVLIMRDEWRMDFE